MNEEAHSTYTAQEVAMEGSVYVINEIVGTSTESWEDAARNAIETAGKSVEDLRVAEVVEQDVVVEVARATHYSTITRYRIRLSISMKYHPGWKDDHPKR